METEMKENMDNGTEALLMSRFTGTLSSVLTN